MPARSCEPASGAIVARTAFRPAGGQAADDLAWMSLVHDQAGRAMGHDPIPALAQSLREPDGRVDPFSGDAVTVTVTSRGTHSRTTSSTESVGMTSKRG